MEKEGTPPPSRNRRKDEANRKREIADEIAALNEADFRALAIPDDIREAFVLARRVDAHGGKRRQLQLVAKMMRLIDTGPIEAQLAKSYRKEGEIKARNRAVERWRDRLMTEGSAGVKALRTAFPTIEADDVTTLVAAARDELRRGPARTHARALFRFLWKNTSG